MLWLPDPGGSCPFETFGTGFQSDLSAHTPAEIAQMGSPPSYQSHWPLRSTVVRTWQRRGSFLTAGVDSRALRSHLQWWLWADLY